MNLSNVVVLRSIDIIASKAVQQLFRHASMIFLRIQSRCDCSASAYFSETGMQRDLNKINGLNQRFDDGQLDLFESQECGLHLIACLFYGQ